MDYLIRLFFSVILAVFRRYWYITPGIPIALMAAHGMYTGSWYVWTCIIASFVIASLITLRVIMR